MNTIVVTGGNGSFGSHIVADLAEKGYEIIVLDRKEKPDRGPERSRVVTKLVDLMNYREVEQAMKGGDALIHMAAIPDPLSAEPPVVFANNVVSTFHVLEAASKLDYRRAVIASSESAYGFPWAQRPLSPLYLPVDEHHPLIPHDCYGTSKAVNEATGESFFRKTGMQVVALRLSSIGTPAMYRYFHDRLDRPEELRRVLWSYVDIRDAASACILALERDGLGSVALNICADETFSDIPSRELIRRYYPEVSDIRAPFAGFEALYSNAKAKELLHWRVAHRWRHRQP